LGKFLLHEFLSSSSTPPPEDESGNGGWQGRGTSVEEGGIYRIKLAGVFMTYLFAASVKFEDV